MKYRFLRSLLTSCVVIATVLSTNVVRAQSLPPGVQDVVKLKQAGLSDDVILSQVRNSGAIYNLSVDQIIQLKQAGVSEAVIKVLISGNGSAVAPAAPATPAPVAAVPAAPAPVVTTPPPAPTAAAVATPPVAAPADANASPDASYQAQLSPYGNWVQVPGYGLCWQPTVAVNDPLWRPYFDSGHWTYTDAGWSWQSDYPWGNIAFHYGRWFRHDGLWVWAPGYDWAPAWVSWRESDGYSGWAPLPPAAVFRPGLGLYYNGVVAADVDFGLGPDDFTFVPYDHFWDFRLRAYFVPHERVVVFFHDSRIMNGYRMDHGHFVVEGFGRDHVALVTHHEIRVVHDSHVVVVEPRGGRDVVRARDTRDAHDPRDRRDQRW